MVTPRILTDQQLASFPLTGIHLIEASAGSGKTFCLAHLFVRHILQGRPVRQILTVTFTKAAAEELKIRIKERLSRTLELLEARLKGDSVFEPPLTLLLAKTSGRLEWQRLRLQLALRSLDELAIYTIHGFCRRILEEFAYLAGQPFDCEVVEEDPFFQEALIDWWRRNLYPLDGAKAKFYASILGNFSPFRARFLKLWHWIERPLFEPSPPSFSEWQAELAALERAKIGLAELWRKRGEQLKELLLKHERLSRSEKSGYKPEILRESLAKVEHWLNLAERQDFSEAEISHREIPSRHSDWIYETPEEAILLLTRSHLEGSLKKKGPEFPLSDPLFVAFDDWLSRFQKLKNGLLPVFLQEALLVCEEHTQREKRRQALRTFDDLIREVDQALAGPLGQQLRESVRRRFPVALIDEFQDTDPVQYRIFRRLYVEASPELPLQLVMIGDPKQAIYQFRGADVFAYLQARRDARHRWTLATNWRSSPELIEAVNVLFDHHPNPFLLEEIGFEAARKAPRPHHPHLLGDGSLLPTAFLWFLPADFDEKGRNRLTKEQARERVMHAVAQEVVRLTSSGQSGRLKVQEGEERRPVEPKDIAILVRRHEEGRALKKILARYGVQAVVIERESVFRSEAARALLDLLEAVAAPEDRSAARRGLASRAMALAPEELDRWLFEEELWNRWIELLEESRQIWQQRGFMPAFLHLLASSGMAERLASFAQPERFLTDLLHTAELLQVESLRNPEIEALIRFMRERISAFGSRCRSIEAGVGEEARLRLEDDEALVKISTIHASKGLEWPIVFVPTLWDVRGELEDLLFWHDEAGNLHLTYKPLATEEILRKAQREQWAEELRLLYVALTRAKSRFYLVFGAIGQKGNHAGTSPLAYLLLPEFWQEGEVPLDQIREEVLREKFGRHLTIAELPLEETEAIPSLPRKEEPLKCREFQGTIATDFAVQSFTSMARGLPPVEGLRAAPAEERLPLALRFPAGAEVGAFLHKLLEELDFHQITEESVRTLGREIAPRFGLPLSLPFEELTLWLQEVVATPILDGMALKEIPREKQLREWSFELATARVDPEKLTALLERLEPRGEKPPLQVEAFRGMVSGIADLVFEWGGKFYLADYKSNLLGRSFEDYKRERIEEAMRFHRYDLQYALYTLALHRFLQKTLPGYDYERHFGGIYYLFLRGMRPQLGEGYGVFFTRPPLKAVEKLDREIFRHHGSMA